MTDCKIGVLRIDTPFHRTYWAFDLPEEFSMADWIVRNRSNCEVTAYHFLDRQNRFQSANHNALTDDEWLKISAGTNDAWEVERMLAENGLLQGQINETPTERITT